MSQTHSPAPARKLKKYLPHVTSQSEALCFHTVAGVHSFAKMTILEALKAIAIMKNNDQRHFQMSIHKDSNMNLINSGFHSLKIVHRLIQESLFLSGMTKQQMQAVQSCFLKTYSRQLLRHQVWNLVNANYFRRFNISEYIIDTKIKEQL